MHWLRRRVSRAQRPRPASVIHRTFLLMYRLYYQALQANQSIASSSIGQAITNQCGANFGSESGTTAECAADADAQHRNQVVLLHLQLRRRGLLPLPQPPVAIPTPLVRYSPARALCRTSSRPQRSWLASPLVAPLCCRLACRVKDNGVAVPAQNPIRGYSQVSRSISTIPDVSNALSGTKPLNRPEPCAWRVGT